MGKRSTREKDGDTRILFKKSQHTIYTQSRTCSGLSQINTRSGIIQIKKNLSQHQYYVEGEKIKRDLSTETGICILRRYYKKKKNRMSTQEGSKSKYSTVNTEIDTIEEFRHDTSANGNSELTETNNEQYNISKMMKDNFKYLLNNWIETYLLDDGDAKEKLESVLYSLLHRTELDRTSTSSSRSTYILNRERLSQEVKNKKVATTSIICQYCQNQSLIKNTRNNSLRESSCHSTPASHKNIKVISTLSIPKNLHAKGQDRNDKSNHKIKKQKQKNALLINKPSKILDCSSFDLLTISTKSFTKRCATYDCDGKKKKRKKKRHIVFLPKPFYKSATDSTTDENKYKTRETNKSNLQPMPSLMKSIYADDPANITSTDDNIHIFKNDNFTMTDENNSLAEIVNIKTDKVESKTVIDNIVIDACESEFLHESILNEQDRSDPMMAIDFMNESLIFSKLVQPKIEAVCTKTKATDTGKANNENNKQIKNRRKNSRRISKFYKPEKKRMRIKNDKKSWSPSQRFLGHCENILQYFADYENKNNMKLDIHITVLPVNNFQNKSTNMSKQDLQNYEKCETLLYNIGPTSLNKPKLSKLNNLENDHNIIPLLDGADNQSKYIFKSGTCSENTAISCENNSLTIDRSTITDAEIRDDINELKSVIKDLTKAAEAFVKGHIRKETKPSQCDKDIIRKMENISKGIQFSKEISKHPLLSGIKLSKEPKKIDYNELYNRLVRKSTSYNIIDSESILRVTDMTSAANEIHKTNKSVKSLPNSRSMIEVTNDLHKKRLLTYFCDEYNKDDFIYNTCAPAPACPKMWLKLHKNKKCPEPVCMIDSGEIMELIGSDCDGCKPSTTFCSDDEDVEKCTHDREPVCHRAGMGFGEGCFYCMLMWIPVILIASLLYSYVIKEAIYPNNPALGLREGALPANGSLSLSYKVKLSDLEKLASKMQSGGGNKTSKTRKARPKSQTRFPKKFPSQEVYVVAFSLKQTFDDLVTAQQRICNKRSPQSRSPQESTNSITPTNSLKMFDTEHSDKLNQILDEPDAEATKVNNKNSPHDSTNSIGSMTPTNSLKYLSSDKSDASLITIGEQEKQHVVIDLSEAVVQNTADVNAGNEEYDDLSKKDVVLIIIEDTEKCVNENAENNLANNVCFNEELTDNVPKSKTFLDSKNQNVNEKLKNYLESQNTKIEPEAIFNAQNSCKYKKKKIRKCPTKTVNIRQKSFKYRNPKKAFNNRLEKYYEKRNLIDADQIQKDLYSDEVSTVVSRTRVLHKIITRENQLEESEFISFINDVGLNEYDNESLSSSLSTAKKSIVSNSSQNTLTQKASSTSSKNEDENVETVNSVIKMPTENVPYKTDVINVAVAVAYNRSKVNARDETVPVPSQEKFMHLGSLTSSEMVTPFTSNLTSNSPSKFEDFKAVTIETSHGTLVNKESSFGVSSDDFVIARTSSDFAKSSDESTETLKNNTDTVVDIETVPVRHSVKENKPTLLETVINLGIYTEMTPSTSSDTPYEYDYNDVIVTKNLNNKYPINSNKGDNKEQEIKNILKKAINQKKDKVMNKTINLPNQAEIKALLKENDIPQMKCAEESRHPSHMPEMWDRLVMILDLAVKRLEDNLVEKIIKELKNTLGHSLPKDVPILETKNELGISKKVAESIRSDSDQGLQCDLVKNTIIDQIMQKLSSDGPKIVKPGMVKALHHSKLFKDIEVLKPPEVQMMTEKGDTVTVSTITYEVCNFRRIKTLFAGPINFIRENVFVITSVPTFFVVLLCVYGLILLLMKLW